MTDFSTPHADCTAKHTKYQPSEAEWRCPKCGADSDAFYIDTPAETAHPDCPALHVDDDVVCGSREHDDRPSWGGRALAALFAKRANVVPCPHCKGKGFVAAKKSGGAA